MGDPNATAAVAPAGQSKVLLVKNSYDYKPSVFDKGFKNRFLGRVDRKNGEIQLVVTCAWSIAEMDGSEWRDPDGSLSAKTSKVLATYQSEFKTVCEQAWSGCFDIVPSIPVDSNFRFKARVVIEHVDSGDPHLLKITLRPGHTNVVSSASSKGTDPDVDRLMDLKLENGKQTVRDTNYEKVQFPPLPSTAVQTHFNRCTATHEFGHHIGNHHPKHGVSGYTGLDEYGTDVADAEGIMGWGSLVKKENYAPFLQVAKKYSDEMNVKSNTWTLEQPNAIATKKKKP